MRMSNANAPRAWIGLPGLLVLALGCEAGPPAPHDAPPPGAPGQAAAPAEPAAPKKVVDPATAGSVSGTVTFGGALPPPTMIRASSDAACAKLRPGEFDAGDVLVKDGKVENAFVWVKTGLEAYTFDPPSGPLSVDQRGCMYTPRVFGARVGQEIQFHNSDQTTHNISAKAEKQRGWNIVTLQGVTKTNRFEKPEVAIRLGCDIHPWMRAYVGVVAHPKFTVTPAGGAFALEGLPPGSYTIGAWHERLGQVEAQVTIGPNEAKALDLALPGPPPR